MLRSTASRPPTPKINGRHTRLAMWLVPVWLGRMFMASIAVSWMTVAPPAWPLAVQNPTGLPLYPNLTTAVLDSVYRTDLLGHWCMHLSAQSSDSLEAVEQWYRRAFIRVSETDLTHDSAYVDKANLAGIKLTSDIDSIAIYRMGRSGATFIDLARCSAVR
jgi:hypothetical protein